MYQDWIENFDGGITVCDDKGIIIYMNERSKKVFGKHGNDEFLGKNVLDCHPEHAGAKLRHLLETRGSNFYTIDKGGVKKLIHQTPWYTKTGEFGGLIELSVEIPESMPNYIRK